MHRPARRRRRRRSRSHLRRRRRRRGAGPAPRRILYEYITRLFNLERGENVLMSLAPEN